MIYIPIWKVNWEISEKYGWVMEAVGATGNILS